MIEDAALKVLTGETPLLDDPSSAGRSPVAIASHVNGEVAAVLFLLHRGDGYWQLDCVAAQRAAEGWSPLGSGGCLVPSPEELAADDADSVTLLEHRVWLRDDIECVAVAGWSRSIGVEAFTALVQEPIGEVGGDGFFVLVAPVPERVPVSVRSAEEPKSERAD